MKIKYELFLSEDDMGDEYSEVSEVEIGELYLVEYVCNEFDVENIDEIDGVVCNEDGSIEVLNDEYGKYYKWSMVG